MKSRSLYMYLVIFCIFIGCSERNQDLAYSPEDALHRLESNINRDITIFGLYPIHDEHVLFVFNGFMNGTDVWFADVRKANDHWEVMEIVQLNGPFEEDSHRQSIMINDEFKYEVGYLKSNMPMVENLKVIEITGIEEWKIWIKGYQIHN